MEGNILLLLLVFFPMVGAIISYIIGRKNKLVRDYFAIGITIVEFLAFFALFFTFKEEQEFFWDGFCYMGLRLSLDGFRVLYGLIASLMWMMTTLMSQQYFEHYRNRNRYYMFTLLTLGATIGVFLSADLYTTFIFFEIMSFTSYVWVAQNEEKYSLRAAATYLAVAVIGGLVMLMGLFLLYNEIGTLKMNELLVASKEVSTFTNLYIAGGLILFGFGAKAGMFPLHIWLPKAHPVAPAPASALLSGVLTKTGVFGILVISSQIFLHDAEWGKLILFLGTITMFLGAFLAIFSIDLKRTLALSSMSQIGFILVGVGMQGILGHHNALAVRGTLLHMVNHSLFKLVLFMIAGVVMMNTHKLNLNDIRGFGRKKPLLGFSFAMGALGIMGIPLWNGYISKTLLHESIVEYIHLLEEEGHAVMATPYQAVEWIFLISGGLTIAYMTKLFVAIFIEKNPEKQEKMDQCKNYMDKKTTFAIVASAVILPILGLFPYVTMNKIADLAQEFLHGENPAHAVHYFTFVNLKGAIISIVIGIIVYFLIIRTLFMKKDEQGNRVYVDVWPAWLDLETLIYRPVLLGLLPFLGAVFSRIVEWVTDFFVLISKKTVFTAKKEREETSGSGFMYTLGNSMDAFVRVMNKTIYKNAPRKTDYAEKFAEYQFGMNNASVIIRRSLSYGLLMFCIGFVITLFYILI